MHNLGLISKKLTNLDRKGRSLYKATCLAKVRFNNNQFIHKGYRIIFIKTPIVENGLLKVTVRAFFDNKEIILNTPFLYKNPPIMVADGTFRNKTFNGSRVTLPNFKENTTESLKEIIVQTVERASK